MIYLTPTCGEEALGEDYECVGEMGVGWGVWSWSIVLANIKGRWKRSYLRIIKGVWQSVGLGPCIRMKG
jgi:hypothetical protein